MKIAILTTYFWPDENGLTRYIDGLYSSLLKKHPDIEVDVIAFDTLKTGKYEEKYKNFNVRRVKCIPILGRTYAFPTISGCRQLKKIFRKNKYDIINTHTRFFFTSFLGIRLGKKYDIPVIHTEHGGGFVQHGNKFISMLAKAYDLVLGKYTIKNSKMVCPISKVSERFVKKLGARNTTIIYNGISIDFWKERNDLSKMKAALNIEGEDVVFSFVGRLVPSKGCQDIFEVLRYINIKNWKLLIAGEGFYKKKLELLVEKYNLKNNIIFLGYQNESQLRNLYQLSDLYINSSFAAEGGPRTILEASAAGCRCLSTGTGFADEVLDKENIYESGNISELKEKISNYKKLPVADVRQFDWENISSKFFKVLKSL